MVSVNVKHHVYLLTNFLFNRLEDKSEWGTFLGLNNSHTSGELKSNAAVVITVVIDYLL